jgi:plasmid stabilization system protein ParE
MRTLRVRRSAEVDIFKAAKWYEKKVPLLGLDFAAEVRRTLSLIATDPERFSIVHQRFQLRRALVSRFPYRIFYTIEPSEVVVHAVLHGHRSDRVWQKRMGGGPT